MIWASRRWTHGEKGKKKKIEMWEKREKGKEKGHTMYICIYENTKVGFRVSILNLYNAASINEHYS